MEMFTIKKGILFFNCTYNHTKYFTVVCFSFGLWKHVRCIMIFISASNKGTYDHTIVNDDLEDAYEILKGILIQVGLNRICVGILILN